MMEAIQNPIVIILSLFYNLARSIYRSVKKLNEFIRKDPSPTSKT